VSRNKRLCALSLSLATTRFLPVAVNVPGPREFAIRTSCPSLAIAMKDGRPFTFAGLWENWKDPESGEWLPSAIFCAVALQRALNGFSFCTQPGEISATFREKRLNPLLPLLFAKRIFEKSQADARRLRIRRVAAISMSVSEVCTLYS